MSGSKVTLARVPAYDLSMNLELPPFITASEKSHFLAGGSGL